MPQKVKLLKYLHTISTVSGDRYVAYKILLAVCVIDFVPCSEGNGTIAALNLYVIAHVNKRPCQRI